MKDYIKTAFQFLAVVTFALLAIGGILGFLGEVDKAGAIIREREDSLILEKRRVKDLQSLRDSLEIIKLKLELDSINNELIN